MILFFYDLYIYYQINLIVYFFIIIKSKMSKDQSKRSIVIQPRKIHKIKKSAFKVRKNLIKTTQPTNQQILSTQVNQQSQDLIILNGNHPSIFWNYKQLYKNLYQYKVLLQMSLQKIYDDHLDKQYQVCEECGLLKISFCTYELCSIQTKLFCQNCIHEGDQHFFHYYKNRKIIKNFKEFIFLVSNDIFEVMSQELLTILYTFFDYYKIVNNKPKMSKKQQYKSLFNYNNRLYILQPIENSVDEGLLQQKLILKQTQAILCSDLKLQSLCDQFISFIYGQAN